MESTSRLGAFLRSVTPDRRPGDYQHAACRILNGIARRTEATLQTLPPGTPGKAQALAALQAFKQALKDETSGMPILHALVRTVPLSNGPTYARNVFLQQLFLQLCLRIPIQRRRGSVWRAFKNFVKESSAGN